jgi:hypothetical protein
MIPERSDHPLPAGDALLMTHLEGITDRLRDLKFVIWIDYECAHQLLGCARKLRKDQDPRVYRILSRDVFLRDQVHAIAHRCDKSNECKPVKAGEYRSRISTGDVLDRHPAGLAQRAVYPSEGFIHGPA